MEKHTCKVATTIFVPLDEDTIHIAIVVPKHEFPHTHPPPPPKKVPADVKHRRHRYQRVRRYALSSRFSCLRMIDLTAPDPRLDVDPKSYSSAIYSPIPRPVAMEFGAYDIPSDMLGVALVWVRFADASCVGRQHRPAQCSFAGPTLTFRLSFHPPFRSPGSFQVQLALGTLAGSSMTQPI
jgi:hypothetical protein